MLMVKKNPNDTESVYVEQWISFPAHFLHLPVPVLEETIVIGVLSILQRWSMHIQALSLQSPALPRKAESEDVALRLTF